MGGPRDALWASAVSDSRHDSYSGRTENGRFCGVNVELVGCGGFPYSLLTGIQNEICIASFKPRTGFMLKATLQGSAEFTLLVLAKPASLRSHNTHS